MPLSNSIFQEGVIIPPLKLVEQGKMNESLEYTYPFIVTEYSVRRGTGGKGEFAGGDGLIREIKLLSDLK